VLRVHKSFVWSGLGTSTARRYEPRQTMRIALYEPDIPQNTGTILRTCACLGVEAHIIEPAGFPVTDRAFRRAGMDYLDQVAIVRHGSFAAFDDWRRQNGLVLVLLTTAAERSYVDHRYSGREVLLLGRESAGVPPAVHAAADIRLRIPIRAGLRSLNIAMAAAMVAGEALRQTSGFPPNDDTQVKVSAP
jgi:tRNA (cytidine/uridine-2'-O-)-methyltransferase